MGSTLSGLTGSGQSTPPPSSGRASAAAEPRRISKASIDAKISGWVAEKKLAPPHQSEGRAGQPAHECPICFIDYIALNETKCCHCTICTDCFSQLLLKGESVVCPFCTDAIKLSYSEPAGGAMADAPNTKTASTSVTAPTTVGTKEILLSSVEARRELEAEMTAHRHMAGDVEDIEVVDRRARSMSRAARMAAHLNRAGGRRRSDPHYRTQQMYGVHSHFGDNSSDEEYEQNEPFQRREPLPYLRGGAVTSAATRTPTSRFSAPRTAPPPREEWLALHDLLVNARHSEAGIGDEHVSQLEERMLEQAMRQSLIDSGGPVAETPSAAPAAALAAPVEAASESQPQGTDLRLSDLSLASTEDLDEDAQLELALALSLTEAQYSSADNRTPPASASGAEQESIVEGTRPNGSDEDVGS